jgi:adenine-specific DNA-methyltransferase
MYNQFFNTVLEVLKQDQRFFTNNGELLRNSVYEAAMQMDLKLIKLLLSNEETKKRFFTEVEGVLVFDKVGFGWVINNRQFLPDSYTRYKNKIGLVNSKNEYISTSKDVVLVFPYKDCVLEGGQTKEDQKRNEIFYNETLAPDEVDRLLYPKVFTNAKRYTANGVETITEFKDTDNVIIKGNNLLAIASLSKRYEGRIKCIYLDPPYYFNKNKPTDTFKYNSNFKLSTWLVFMKDRLLLAKKLLSDDGIIFCHIGEDGVHWLKVLMEEIFGADNFIETFIWKNTDNPDSISNKSRSAVEYIICYEKIRNNSTYVGKETENGDVPLLNSGNNIHELRFPKGSIKFNIPDGIYKCGKPDRVEIMTPITVRNGTNENEVVLKGEFKWSQQTLDKEIKKGTYFLIKSKKFSIRFQRPKKTTMAPEKYIDEQYLTKAIGVGTNEDANAHLKKLGLNFSYSKPESVIAFLIKAVTKEKDIVMDFFLGSGTTAAVAHKMKRQYIGVDQMEYIETIAVERLKKVISGEQGGISKAFNWQGGGSFVYCELAKLNQNYADRIQIAKDDKELADIWYEIKETGFISCYVNPKDINPEAEDFKSLSFEEKKRLLMELLDKNQLYVNYCDIDDEDYNISDADKAFTKSFYEGV